MSLPTSQMEGVRVFSLSDWEPSGTDGTSYAADNLKKCLEGLARHLFGKCIELRNILFFPFWLNYALVTGSIGNSYGKCK